MIVFLDDDPMEGGISVIHGNMVVISTWFYSFLSGSPLSEDGEYSLMFRVAAAAYHSVGGWIKSSISVFFFKVYFTVIKIPFNFDLAGFKSFWPI